MEPAFPSVNALELKGWAGAEGCRGSAKKEAFGGRPWLSPNQSTMPKLVRAESVLNSKEDAAEPKVRPGGP